MSNYLAYDLVANYIFYVEKTANLAKLTVAVRIITKLLSIKKFQTYGIKGSVIAFILLQSQMFIGSCAIAKYHYPMP